MTAPTTATPSLHEGPDVPFVPEPPASDSWLVVVCVIAAAALLISVISIGFGMRAIDESKKNTAVAAGSSSAAAASPAGAPSMVNVALAEFSVTPKVIKVATGGMLMVTNNGTMAHDLAIEGQNLKTPMLNSKGEADLNLGALAPGTYTVYCEVPGHREAGMTASLEVVAGSNGSGSGSTAAAASPAAATTPTTMSSAQMDEVMAKSTKAFPAKTAGLGAQDLAPKVLPDGTKEFDITSKVVKWEVEPGKFVDAWTYNGTVPGPTLRVNDGDKVKVVLKNELPESTVIHWHGIDVPNAMDGVPFITQDPVKPGDTFTYAFTAHGPAVGMYHSHFDAAKQVSDGLAGAFIIGHEPVPAGVTVSQEQTMMLNDSGVLSFSLNGKSFPATAPYSAKLGDWIEVHYLNEGVMAHPMHLHGLPQLVIAKDGFPVAQPYQEDTVLVAPGERYTVLVHATEPGVWAWHCHILTHAERDDGMFGMVTALIVK